MCDPFGDREIGLDSIIRRSSTSGYQCMTPSGSATACAQALMGQHFDAYAGIRLIEYYLGIATQVFLDNIHYSILMITLFL